MHSVKSVFEVPDALSDDEAAMLDPAAIALHTVVRGGHRPGDVVAVVGPGVMGLLVADCARALGAGRVVVVGRGERLAKAAALGHEIVDVTAGDPVAAVRELTRRPRRRRRARVLGRVRGGRPVRRAWCARAAAWR